MQIDSNSPRRGTFTVESREKCFFLLEFPRVRLHFNTITLLGTACETFQPSQSLAGGPQRQIRQTGPFKASVAPHGRFQHPPRRPGMSRISTFGDAVTVAKGDYNCCVPVVKISVQQTHASQERGFAQTSKNTLNTFRSTSLTTDRTAFRCVQTGVRPRD